MAAELAPALLGFWTVRDGACSREESFADLFPLLGDQEALDAARAEAPGKRHCGLLEKHPLACRDCALKENPYKGRVDEKLAAVRNAGLVAEALELYSDFQVGLLDIKQATPEEAMAVRLVLNQEKFHLARMQGAAVAAILKG